MKRRFFCAALAVLLALLAAAPCALAEGTPARLGEGYSAVLYDNSNGLPTSEANAIVQSADGYIWIGSYSGLIRYDGNRFYRYDASSGVSSVVTIYSDSRGRIWSGTNDSGAAVNLWGWDANQGFTAYDGYNHYNAHWNEKFRVYDLTGQHIDNSGHYAIYTEQNGYYYVLKNDLSTMRITAIRGSSARAKPTQEPMCLSRDTTPST